MKPSIWTRALSTLNPLRQTKKPTPAVPGPVKVDPVEPVHCHEDKVLMPLGGRVREIDRCISHLVAALNAANVRTVASCCGHGYIPGRIDLEDGRWLWVATEAFRSIDGMVRRGWPSTIWGESLASFYEDPDAWVESMKAREESASP